MSYKARTQRECVEQRINQKPGKWTRPPYFNLIACQKIEMRNMPGGEFLWVRMAPNTSGYTKDRAMEVAKETGTIGPDGLIGPTAAQIAHSIRSIHCGFTLSAETAPWALMLIGMEPKHGAMVFEYEMDLYTRAYRHEVQGRSRTDYTKWYNTHAQVWRGGKPGGYMCLKPFHGEYLRLKANPADKKTAK